MCYVLQIDIGDGRWVDFEDSSDRLYLQNLKIRLEAKFPPLFFDIIEDNDRESHFHLWETLTEVLREEAEQLPRQDPCRPARLGYGNEEKNNRHIQNCAECQHWHNVLNAINEAEIPTA